MKIYIILINLFFYSFAQDYKIENFKKNQKIEIKKQLKKKQSLMMSKWLLRKYYKNHGYELFWFNEKGLKNISYELINEVKNDPILKKSLNTLIKKYDLLHKTINSNEKNISKDIIVLDFLLTDIYHKYMQYLNKGIINWNDFKEKLKKVQEEKNISVSWDRYTNRKHLRKLLYKIVRKDNITFAFKELKTNYPKRKELSEKLKFYENRLLNGDFIKIKTRKVFRLKQKSKYIEQIKTRLVQGKYLRNNLCESINKKEELISCNYTFNKELQEAIIEFQKDHGLKADGIIGTKTIQALNISAKTKIKIIKLNIERMKWLPKNLGEKYILVNIPAFQLDFIKNEEIDFSSKIIIGEKKYPTPVFSNKLSFVVLNPYWRIPQSIVKNEILPSLIQNPSYLDNKDINIHETWEEDSQTFNVKTIDWTYYLKNENKKEDLELPVKFIQGPNGDNPLGKVKFMFPNKYSVYLHDSPIKHLFKNSKRAFSHGCIRINKPKELLKKISTLDKNLDFTFAKNHLKKETKEKINLNKKIPIHIVYLTSWVNKEGKIQFRNDIYGYDKLQINILNKNNVFL